MNAYENMNREELMATLAEMATRNPNQMTREELAEMNTAMSALDEMNSED